MRVAGLQQQHRHRKWLHRGTFWQDRQREGLGDTGHMQDVCVGIG